MSYSNNTLPALRQRAAQIAQRQFEEDLTPDGHVAHPEYLGERIAQALTAELAELHAWRMAWLASVEYAAVLHGSNLPPAETKFALHVLNASQQMTDRIFTESGLAPPRTTLKETT
jgi:hypothetical protein